MRREWGPMVPRAICAARRLKWNGLPRMGSSNQPLLKGNVRLRSEGAQRQRAVALRLRRRVIVAGRIRLHGRPLREEHIGPSAKKRISMESLSDSRCPNFFAANRCKW